MHKALLTLTFLIPFIGISQNDSIVNPTDSLDLTAITVLSAGDLETESQSQDISGLLQSSRDVFTSVAGFNFSAARFRMRGLDNKNFTMMMNGVPMNDPELGFAIWANWGGLNDITRYPESRPGISSNNYHFGSIGGFSNIDLRASKMRKGTRISQSATNRSYRNRTMITHNTGWLDNDWAFSSSLSYRWAEEGYVEGTYYSGLSYFLSAEKRINDNHHIGFIGFGSPTVRGRSGLAQQEVYDLVDNNYYNPYWGYQNGEKRNSRIRNSHKPTFIVWDEYKFNENTRLKTNLYGQVGKYSQTRLNWFDAKDPRPDYYRYLPSYFTETPDEMAEVTNLWQTDDSYRQIDWDQLYFANGKNLYTLDNANGTGTSLTGNRSKYIVEETRSDPRLFGVNSVIDIKKSDKLNISAGLHAYTYKSKNYKIMNDLLGGDYWVDVDQFALRDFDDESVAQNDLLTYNKVIEEGDEFGYNYDIHSNKAEVFGQAEYKVNKIELYGALNLGSNTIWRVGNYQNGRFPESSIGESEKKNFLSYGAKAGAVYKFSGRHIVSANILSMSRAPQVRNSFLSPRTRNEFAAGLENEKVLGGEINYHVRYPNLKVRATAFYNQINDQIWNRSFYHDELFTFVNYAMTGVDQVFTGIELGFEAKATQTVTVKGAFTTGEYFYNSRPTATITADNSSEVIAENRTVYLKNYSIGGSPRTAANLGFSYNSPKYWFIGAEANYFDQLSLSPNPDRRTDEAVTTLVDSDPQWTVILGQEDLDDGFALNMNIGKSWRFDYKYYLLLTFNVTNVLDNTDFKTGGYEQLRYDSADIGRFPPKYGYMYGRAYFMMVRFSF